MVICYHFQMSGKFLTIWPAPMTPSFLTSKGIGRGDEEENWRVKADNLES